MNIQDLITQLQTIASENPTATVVNGAEALSDSKATEKMRTNPTALQPVERVLYKAKNNTIIIDP